MCLAHPSTKSGSFFLKKKNKSIKRILKLVVAADISLVISTMPKSHLVRNSRCFSGNAQKMPVVGRLG